MTPTPLNKDEIDEILTKVLFLGNDSGRPNELGWKVINEAKQAINRLIAKERLNEAQSVLWLTGEEVRKSTLKMLEGRVARLEQSLLEQALEEGRDDIQKET